MQIYAIIVSTGFLSTIFPFFLMQESAFVVEMARVELKVFADSHNMVISSVRGRLNMSFHFTRGLSYFLFVTVVTQSQTPQSSTSTVILNRSLFWIFQSFLFVRQQNKNNFDCGSLTRPSHFSPGSSTYRDTRTSAYSGMIHVL